ncbi:hypothetical protein GWK47_012103 [Chionoecetes opilio]|uniref:Uncharacterized protein n=1 Tax=Chionoecetes opilio TaxID=41210 RepID=A0A8J5CPK1_CHIOP|nr:hypothetical protein GWK47_012103 [Chionoecetes opilio]
MYVAADTCITKVGTEIIRVQIVQTQALMKRQSQVTRLGGAYLNAPEGSPSIPKASLEERLCKTPLISSWSTLRKPCSERHTTHPITQGILTLLVPHTVENALEMVSSHGGDAPLPHSVIHP